MKRTTLVLLLVGMFSMTALADDLYRIEVESPEQLTVLSQADVRPIMRLSDGILIISPAETADALRTAGITVEIIAADVIAERLATDTRRDELNKTRYRLLFEDGDLRLYDTGPQPVYDTDMIPNVFPIGEREIKLTADQPSFKPMRRSADVMDLQTLIDMVDQDSLEAFSHGLEDTFFRRVVGTPENDDARDWLVERFESFDYDSVITDYFVENWGAGNTDCYNVLAYKIGTVYPNQHVIVGAHRDAVPGSPGSDDNGSGTCGVLEIARVLKDIETDMTIVFVLFDAEEVGLYGSWHYADEADADGDSIIYMLNMDMIAYEPNVDQAELYHGADTEFSELWRHLADSLLDLTGYLVGNTSGSDHYPFTQYQIPSTFVAEYIFNTPHYHSSTDSTTYMDFVYMTDMVKASLATVYMVSQTAAPDPGLAFEYPGGRPRWSEPYTPATFDMTVQNIWTGIPVPASGLLYYSVNGGPYSSLAMTETSPGQYTVEIPGSECGDRISYYISVDETTLGPVYDPDPSEPYTLISAVEAVDVFTDSFNTPQGWTVTGSATDGQWGRGIPAGGGNRGDPPTDFDGTSWCYLTDNIAGDSDVDGGSTYLTTPTLDLTNTEALVSFACWYSNDFGNAPYLDTMKVDISNDNGLQWTRVHNIGPLENASGGWHMYEFFLNDFIAGTDQTLVRFTAEDLGAGSVIEAAVDAFVVTTFNCNICDCAVFCDLDGNGSINPTDVIYIVNYVYKGIDNRVLRPDCPLENGDFNCDGKINPQDVIGFVNFVYREIVPGPDCDPCDL